MFTLLVMPSTQTEMAFRQDFEGARIEDHDTTARALVASILKLDNW